MPNDASTAHRTYSVVKILFLAFLLLSVVACTPKAHQDSAQISTHTYTVRNPFPPVADTADLFRISLAWISLESVVKKLWPLLPGKFCSAEEMAPMVL